MWSALSVAQQEQGDSKRKIVSRVEPVYPELARRMNITGVVKIELAIAPNGSVKSDRIVGGHPVLAKSVEDAIRRWKWAPNAQETTEMIEIRFSPKE